MLFIRIKQTNFALIILGISILILLNNKVHGQDTLINKSQSFYNLIDTLVIKDLKQFVWVGKKQNTTLVRQKNGIKDLGSFKGRYGGLGFSKNFFWIYILVNECDNTAQSVSISSITLVFHHMFANVPLIDFADVYLDGLCSIEKNKKKKMDNYKVYRSKDKKRMYVHLVYENLEKEMCEITYIFVYDKYVGRVFDKIRIN